MNATFTHSTKEMVALLGLGSEKTLFRRRTDYAADLKGGHQFLERGIHFTSKTPGSTQLVWDPERTKAAWQAACSAHVNGAQS